MKNSGLGIRAISAVVLVAILLAVGLSGGWLMLIFCIVVAAGGMKELYSAIGLYDKCVEDKKNNMLSVTGIVLCVCYFVTAGIVIPLFTMRNIIVSDIISGSMLEDIQVTKTMQLVSTLGYMGAALAYVFIVIIVMACIYVFSFPRFDLRQVTYAIFGALYTPLFLTSVYLIRCQDNGKYLFWLIFISSWICDTCAYFVGSTIGKRKLAPVLSPKKSVEGAIGGVAGSVIVAFVFGYFVQYKLFNGSNNVIPYMIICFFGACFSQIGDLFASAIKRNHEIKDYGTLIPGHGGILDRFDSVIFVAPVIYVLTLCLF